MLIPKIRGFYLDFFVEARIKGYAGRVEAGLARVVFQVDSALAPVKIIIWTLILLGAEALVSYIFGSRLPSGFSRGFELAILLGFSYFTSVGAVSVIEFFRANKMIRKFGEEVHFRSLSISMQIVFFSFFLGSSSVIFIWASPSSF
ncbi:hypothetical protein [Nocardiopsis sp. LOL_012]|uniref:hypothetical protein n=1 Tax=Nocardiopsis sp. LOL_012 TaxID=3345409 RepID=UPI003A8BF04C